MTAPDGRTEPEHPGELQALRTLGDAVLDLWAAKDKHPKALEESVAWDQVRAAHEAWAETLRATPDTPLFTLQKAAQEAWRVEPKATRVLLERLFLAHDAVPRDFDAAVEEAKRGAR